VGYISNLSLSRTDIISFYEKDSRCNIIYDMCDTHYVIFFKQLSFSCHP